MILVIDDSDQERAVIRKMLEAGGYDVREAADGDTAWRCSTRCGQPSSSAT